MHCLVSLLLLAVLLDSDISILRSLSPSQGYAPPYEQSVYKGAERALKVALMSLTLVRILQRVGFSGNVSLLLLAVVLASDLALLFASFTASSRARRVACSNR